MSTQLAPSYPQIVNAATAPVIRRQLIPRKTAMQPKLHPLARRATAQALERQQRVVEMLPLVKRMAFQIREHLPAHVEVGDLLANGTLGLVDAVAKFDSAKRVKLESYARHRIRGGILDGLRGADPASRDLRRKNKRIQQVYHELEAKLGRQVADEEIAAALGISLSQWHRTLDEVQAVGFDGSHRTLSAGPTTKRLSSEPTLLTDQDESPFELCYHREQHEILNRAISHLRERERQIITLYYQQDLTMKQIADRLNVDESRVSQLHSAALVRLKACVESILQPRCTASPKVPASLAMAA